MKMSHMLLGICAFLAPEVGSAAQRPPNPALVIFGSDTIRAEVVRSPEQLQRGLMFRDAVPEGTGMLFIFERPAVQGIWMKDTYVPLDVAFLDASFRIVNIESLEPLNLTTRRSTRPVPFALEVRQGWFAENGIEPGAQAQIQFR
jgi:uncharacterized membrane protein (UPF0127 family)